MNKAYYIYLSIIFIILGGMFFGIQNDFIIFRWPTRTSPIQIDKNLSTKKSIKLFYWNNSKWMNESIDILISGNTQDDIQHIIISWLNLLDEEKIIEKISLQTALISENSNELFLSFDRNLISEEISTYEKLMLIEGLLKTLRENGIKIPKINFLVYHKTMQDAHLDFSNPWPLEGFLKI